MIFLHGWLHSAEVWREVADYFSSYYRTVEVDLPGFGKSSALDMHNFTLNSYSEYVNSFISNITGEVQKPIIVADSLSAILCLQMMKTQTMKFHHLFLMGCPLDGLPFFISILSKTKSLVLLLSIVKKLPCWLVNIFVKDLNFITLWNRSINSRTLIDSAKRTDPQSAQKLLVFMSAPFKPEVKNNSGRITLLRGSYDRLVHNKTLKKLSACLNSATIVEIPESGHSVMLENPLKLIKCINNHLKTDERGKKIPLGIHRP